MFKALRTQIAVIAALVIRGMQNERRHYAYGYVWTFIQPAATIGILRLLQHLTGLEPTGMGPTEFLVLGVFSIFLFTATWGATSKSSRRGVGILPRVSPLDQLLSQAILTFITYCILFWLFAIGAAYFDGCWPPEDPLGVQVALIADWLLGVSFAFVFSAIARYFPPISEFRKFIVRPLRMISGMFFVITALPSYLWPYFTWNPVLHVSELLRSYWFSVYTTPVGSLPFIAMWIGGMTVLGLALERYMRRIILE